MTNQKIKAAEDAVQQAKEALVVRHKELAEARRTQQRAKALWDQGDGSSEEKLIADLEVQRLGRGVRADEQRLNLARRRVRALDPVLAAKAAHVLGDSIFSTPAKVSASRPTKATKDVEVTVTEVRTNEPNDEHSGSVKGSVLVCVTGPAYLRPFDPYEVARQLGRGGFNLGFGTNLYTVREDALGVFSCEFYVESALPLTVILPRVLPTYVGSMLGKSHVDQLKQKTYSTVAGANMLVGTAGAKLVSEEIGSDGKRRATVEAYMQCYPARAGVGVGQVGAAVNDFVTKHFAAGRGFHGVGVVESAEVHGGIGSFMSGQGVPNVGSKVTARVVLVSAVPQ